MFVTRYADILALIDQIDPIGYGVSRNYLDGQVTKLSPYISRGVISTKQVARAMLKKGYAPEAIDAFLKELAWRDYFQQIWIAVDGKINEDLKHPQEQVAHQQMPVAIMNGSTGIEIIDRGIREFYETGYLHNHLRLYIASIACNVGQSHWLVPAKWMYYHLLDADWASNALSWQWVAGSFSNKKYWANQENINKYSRTSQRETFLDIEYSAFETLAIPDILKGTTEFKLKTNLPAFGPVKIDPALPVYVYNFYNLDCAWDKTVRANRILLLEPWFFEKYPVSDQSVQFVLDLSKNISGIQIAVGNFDDVFDHSIHAQIHFKEHPTSQHYKGTQHSRDWMFEHIKGYHHSFFNYWKHCARSLHQLM